MRVIDLCIGMTTFSQVMDLDVFKPGKDGPKSDRVPFPKLLPPLSVTLVVIFVLLSVSMGMVFGYEPIYGYLECDLGVSRTDLLR